MVVIGKPKLIIKYFIINYLYYEDEMDLGYLIASRLVCVLLIQRQTSRQFP